MPATRALRSTTRGCKTCCRLKARSWRARSRRAVGRLEDLVEVGPLRVVFGERFAGHLAVTADDGEQVVEVVRDAAGEAPYGLHLLRLDELSLQTHLVGDVALHRQVADDPSGGVAHRPDRRVFLEQRSVLAAVHQPPLPHLSAGQRLPHALVERFVLGAALEDPRVLAHRLGGGVPGDALEGRVYVEDGAAGIGDDDRLRGLLDDAAETRLLLLAPLALADVDRQADQSFDLPLVVAEGEARGEEGPRPAVAGEGQLRLGARVGREAGAVGTVHSIGGLGREDLLVGPADGGLAADAGDPFPLAVDEEEAAVAVLDEHHRRHAVEDRLEEALLAFQLGRQALALADVLGERQPRRSTLVDDVLSGDEDGHQGAVLALVAPEPGRAHLAELPRSDVGDDGGDVLRRVDVAEGHGEELLAAVAVLVDRRRVDLEEAQGLDVEDPHRNRVGGEEEAGLRGGVVRSFHWAPASRRCDLVTGC